MNKEEIESLFKKYKVRIPKEKQGPIVITKKMMTIVRAEEKKKERECGQERVKRQLERKYYPG